MSDFVCCDCGHPVFYGSESEIAPEGLRHKTCYQPRANPANKPFSVGYDHSIFKDGDKD